MSSTSENKNNVNGVDRREFLKKSAASSLLLGSGIWLGGSDRVIGNGNRTLANNIIFLVADGMSIGTLINTDMFMRRHLGRVSNWVKLYEENRCERALMEVSPLNAIVTDSAASSSAWGCGHKVPVRKINMGPNDEVYEPVLSLFRNAGKSTGLVTTTRITHATPAGFAANVSHRRMEDDIAQQYLEREHDVYLGGGNRHFAANRRDDGRDMYELFRNKGYDVVRSRDELMTVTENAGRSETKIMGTFARSHLPFSLDREHSPDLIKQVPTLSEMVRTALQRLSSNKNGFILQIEGGRVDHAAHGNNIGGLIFDQLAFDDAVGEALAFQESDPDTLLIITTDHGNASPTLNRSQNGYEATELEFDTLQHFRHTNEWVLRGLSEDSSTGDVIQRVGEATTIEITTEEAEILKLAIRGEYRAAYEMMSQPDAVLGAILANYLSINWTGTTHTGDYVQLAATGPGSEKINGFMENTSLFDFMLESAGIREHAW